MDCTPEGAAMTLAPPLSCPLSRLLIDGRSDDHLVSLRRGQSIGFDHFRTDVSEATVRFRDCRRAALVCQDSYNFIVGFYGLLHAGAKLVLPPNSQAGTLSALHDEFDLLVNDATVEDKKSEATALHPIDSEQSSLIFLTSGSTGEPKKIVKNLAVLEREVIALENLWGKNSGTGIVFATVSHQHIYGLTFKLLWPLMAGRAFCAEMHILWEDLFTHLTPDALIISSPAHLERLDGIIPLSEKDQPKRILSAGAPLSFSASQQAAKLLGCKPTEMFGRTETGAFATRTQTTGTEPWQLFPGMDMRCDATGQLVLRTPFIGEAWIETADRIEPVANGFHFLGRADRIAKIEGKRIALNQVEQSLKELSLVKEAAVTVLTGNPDRLVAVIAPSIEGNAILSEIGSFRFGRLLRSQLSGTQEAAGTPRLWRFVDELPTQAMGKCRNADRRSVYFGNCFSYCDYVPRHSPTPLKPSCYRCWYSDGTFRQPPYLWRTACRSLALWH